MSKNCNCVPSIWQGKYNEKTIYETGCRGPHCLCAHVYYDVEGNLVPELKEGSADFQENRRKVKAKKLIWSCERRAKEQP